MTQEKCPKCGAAATIKWNKAFDDINHFVWDCLSSACIDGSKFYQSDTCKIRVLNTELAALRSQLQQATEERDENKELVDALCDRFECTRELLNQTITEWSDSTDRMIRMAGKKRKDAESELARFREDTERLAWIGRQRVEVLSVDNGWARLPVESVRRVIDIHLKEEREHCVKCDALLSPPAANESEAGDGK